MRTHKNRSALGKKSLRVLALAVLGGSVVACSGGDGSWEELDTAEQTYRLDDPIRISMSSFDMHGIKLLSFVPMTLASPTALNFFLSKPEEALKIHGVDPDSVDVHAIRKAIKDLSGRCEWKDIVVNPDPGRDPISTTSTSSSTSTGSRHDWSTGTTTTSSTTSRSITVSTTSFSGLSDIDREVETVGRWVLYANAGACALAHPALLEAAEVAKCIDCKDLDAIALQEHHIRLWNVTKLIGDTAINEVLRLELLKNPDLVLGAYRLDSKQVEVGKLYAVAKQVGYDIDKKLGLDDQQRAELFKRIGKTDLPMWSTKAEILDIITEDDIAAVEGQSGLTW